MTELGVYILGATALLLLAVAGVHADQAIVIICAVVAAGAAYVSQFGAARAVADRLTHGRPNRAAVFINFVAMLVSLISWLVGVAYLIAP